MAYVLLIPGGEISFSTGGVIFVWDVSRVHDLKWRYC
jgi:hypothetical protein